jgi:pyridoxal phosphate enzyme (YggS family)
VNAIAKSIEDLRLELAPFGARLIAVSKTRQPSEIQVAIESGQVDFGENYVQELIEKQPQLPESVRWHFIGHLQSNKVKYIAGFVHMIHTVDSLKLLQEINKQAAKFNRIIPCLLQVHIAREETKYGLSFQEAEILLNSSEVDELKNVTIVGLMGMATNSDDDSVITTEFQALKLFFDAMKKNHPQLTQLSMGMSSDYRLALNCGSTMVRIGSTIFGERNYPNAT